MHKLHSAGFTIVELLIVIVVIAILASITVFSYRGATGRAADVAILSDLENVQDSLELYESKKGTYPGATEDGINGSIALVMQGIRQNDVMSVEFSKDAYGQSDIYPNQPMGTIMVGFILQGSGKISDICIIARSKSGQNFLLSTSGVVAKTATINSMGGAHDFRTACGVEGKINNASLLTYGGYAL